MTPYPIDDARALGPMRIVVSTYPNAAAARAAVDAVLDRRLAACANSLSVASRYHWKGAVESADEVLVLFKTVPKRVGALFAFLKGTHPYEVPEVVELDVPRADAAYLRYLASTLDPAARPWPVLARSTRPVGPRARGARAPRRIRARHRPPSR